MRRTSIHRWLAMAGRIDRLSEWIGRGVSWLALFMIAIGAYNALARYLGRHVGVNLSSNAYIELQWYAFSIVFLLGAAYTLRRGSHVRVDVLYGRLSARGRAWVDLVGALVFLLPFCLFVIRVSWPSVRNSWAVLESSPDPGGLPRYPLKTMIPVAFALLALQGLAGMIRDVATIRGHAPSTLPTEDDEISR